MERNKIVVFESKQVRRVWHEEAWYFSIVDVCRALTDSPDAGAYWRKLKQRLKKEGSEVVTFCHGLKLEPDTFEKNKKVARRGGSVAGTARKATEKELGRSIISKKNFLAKKQSKQIEE